VVKYWSIASKLELAMAEEDINKKNKVVGIVLIFGLVFFAVISACICIFQRMSRPSQIEICSYLLMAGMVAACLILFDAFRRLKKAHIQNKTISIKAVSVFSLALLAETISIVFTLIKSRNLTSAYFALASQFFFVSALATMIYRIGITSVLDNPSDRDEFD
jgi:hypothetical protein